LFNFSISPEFSGLALRRKIIYNAAIIQVTCMHWINTHSFSNVIQFLESSFGTIIKTLNQNDSKQEKTFFEHI